MRPQAQTVRDDEAVKLAKKLMRRLDAMCNIDVFHDDRAPDLLSAEIAEEIAKFLVTETLINR